MTRRPGFSMGLQVLLWAAGSSAAGAVVGLVVGMFEDDRQVGTATILPT